MKKLCLILLILVISSSLFLGCSEQETQTTTSSATTTSKTSTTTSSSTSAGPTTSTTTTSSTVNLHPALIPPDTGTPIYGGVLREIWSSGPAALSYYPEMGPNEETGTVFAQERLMEYGYDNDIHPFLAEDVIIGDDGKSITFKLRKGVMFSDGTPCNAEAVAWNYRLGDETNKLQYNDRLESIEVVDEYTMVLHVTQYDKLMLSSFGWVPIFSKTAWDNAGSNDDERKAWARANIVGTGPFILKEYKKDVRMVWEKNPNYWQPGKPYLDGYEIVFIPDPVTASAMMEAGEADMWTSGSSVKFQRDLANKGFTLQGSTGTPYTLYFNNKDADSYFTDKRVREAVEYAIDKKTISNALGFGDFFPLENSAGPDMWGYDPNYKGREYNVEKARQLLAEAGYPEGIKVKLTALIGWEDSAQALKQYLDDAGIQVEIDMADAGRFYSMMWFGVGWPDMLLFLQASSPNTLICLHRTFGPEPKTRMTSFVESEELTQMFLEARLPETIDEMKAAAKEIVEYYSQEALLVPLWEVPSNYVIRSYVHTTYLKNSVVARFCADDWMEQH